MTFVSAVIFFLRGGMAYLSGSRGFTGFRFYIGKEARSGLQPVDRRRYERLVRRLVQGGLFDTLWISHHDHENEGLILSLDGDWIELDVGFYPLREPDRLAAFRLQMEAEGRVATEEVPCNEGLGAEMESLTLEYRVETDPDVLIPLVDRILNSLQGPADGMLFVKAWRAEDGPTGSGLKLVPGRDVLSDVP